MGMEDSVPVCHRSDCFAVRLKGEMMETADFKAAQEKLDLSTWLKITGRHCFSEAEPGGLMERSTTFSSYGFCLTVRDGWEFL